MRVRVVSGPPSVVVPFDVIALACRQTIGQRQCALRVFVALVQASAVTVTTASLA